MMEFYLQGLLQMSIKHMHLNNSAMTSAISCNTVFFAIFATFYWNSLAMTGNHLLPRWPSRSSKPSSLPSLKSLQSLYLIKLYVYSRFCLLWWQLCFHWCWFIQAGSFSLVATLSPTIQLFLGPRRQNQLSLSKNLHSPSNP